MLWHEKSWDELADVDKNLPVVLPLGSCEQHGRHLPVFVDTIQVTKIAERVESELQDSVLLLPTLWLGCSHHHKDFPGTISVRPSLYAQMIQDVARSVIRAGFRRLFFLNGHGGNLTPAAEALTELTDTEDRADDVYLALASWWDLGRDGLQPEALGMQQRKLSHACEYETSLMLMLRPELVDVAKITPRPSALHTDWYDGDLGSRKGLFVFRRHHRLTAPGSMGLPERATAEKGAAMFDGVCKQMVAFLKDFATWPDLPPLGPRA